MLRAPAHSLARHVRLVPRAVSVFATASSSVAFRFLYMQSLPNFLPVPRRVALRDFMLCMQRERNIQPLMQEMQR